VTPEELSVSNWSAVVRNKCLYVNRITFQKEGTCEWGYGAKALLPIPKEAQTRRRFPPEDEKGKDERGRPSDANKNHERYSQMLYVWERLPWQMNRSMVQCPNIRMTPNQRSKNCAPFHS